jgi:adenosylhomocysteine nucleosidase
VSNKVLVVMALEQEAQGRFHAAGVEVLFTGIGKVNAAHRLTRKLLELQQRGQVPLVVNFGTAGSRVHKAGAIVACRRFVQRDMDVTGLGFALGQTPFEDSPRELLFDPVFSSLPEAVCATADRFETLEHASEFEVVDMEAYALAKVCRLESTPFACAKFISDGADDQAHLDWEQSLPIAADAFLRLYRGLVQ